MNAYTTVKDAKDVYLELKDEDEAELIEAINRAAEKLRVLQDEWCGSYGAPF